MYRGVPVSGEVQDSTREVLSYFPWEKKSRNLPPVQSPANDSSSGFITTHFDYHSIDGNLLKLDILGHDDPTMIRTLEDMTDLNAREVPLDDKAVMSLFASTEALGIKPEDIGGCKLGCLGIPEFGVMQEAFILVRPPR